MCVLMEMQPSRTGCIQKIQVSSTGFPSTFFILAFVLQLLTIAEHILSLFLQVGNIRNWLFIQPSSVCLHSGGIPASSAFDFGKHFQGCA